MELTDPNNRDEDKSSSAKPNSLNSASLHPALTKLVFPNWKMDDSAEALKQIAEAIKPIKLGLVRELLYNASDSIMLDGKSDTGTIEVTIDKSDGIYISVRDNGQGIDPQVEPYLFQWMPATLVPERLLKMNMPQDLLNGRLGDGLRQLKDYVSGIGGAVGYENFGEHNGALFWLRIPKEACNSD